MLFSVPEGCFSEAWFPRLYNEPVERNESLRALPALTVFDKTISKLTRDVNTKMRILCSVRHGHCLIVSGSPPQQIGRHRVDIGIYGMNIYANVHLHSFVAEGLKSTYCVPARYSDNSEKGRKDRTPVP